VKSSACCPCPAEVVPHPDLSGAIPCPINRNQAGVALITVLLIVFLASITATSLAALQQIAIRRSTVLQHQQQARLYTFGAEQWATLLLARDHKESEVDHANEVWANPPPALPVAGGALSVRVRDLQGCFNLNNLWKSASSTPGNSAEPASDTEAEQEQNKADQKQNSNQNKAEGTTDHPTTPKPTDSSSGDSEASNSDQAQLNQAQFQVLQRLLTSLELKPGLAQAITDWIDPDQDPLFPDGAEDSDYNVKNPAYLAANRSMYSISELRLIRGIDQETYDKLAPLVCALPTNARLNVNTAPAQLLAALSEGYDLKEMEQVLENRPDEGYKNVDDFLNAAKLTVDAQLKAQLSVNSQHFLLQAEARVGDGRAMLYSILYRDENGVRVLQRNFGNQD